MSKSYKCMECGEELRVGDYEHLERFDRYVAERYKR